MGLVVEFRKEYAVLRCAVPKVDTTPQLREIWKVRRSLSKFGRAGLTYIASL